MIRPPNFTGAAFGTAQSGDGRSDRAARDAIATELDLPTDWAWVNQVHGATVLRAVEPGPLGEADALFTTVARLPLTVATADCVPVILQGEGVAAVVHAGWRGAVAGVVTATLAAMEGAGVPAVKAAIGPAIGPCCYEVGMEVAEQFPAFTATTTWGTVSVDVPEAVAAQLSGIELWRADTCTLHDARFHSYRRDATRLRQVAVAWVPA